MKAIVKPRFTANEFKLLKCEIREQCVAEVKKYEVLMDAVIFNAFGRQIGYDVELMKRVYDDIYDAREKVNKEYRIGGLQSDMAQFFELQKHGIDIMKWSENKKSKMEVDLK